MNAALDRILSRPRASRMRFGSVMLVAFVWHVGVGVAAASAGRPVATTPRETEIQALAADEPPPPPPPPEAPEPEKVATTPLPTPNDPPAAPPPAAAAKVMTAPDDAPVDLTGGIVVGSAETYTGGPALATSARARVGSSARGVGSSAATASPAQPSPKGPDLSRAPRLAEGQSWNCAFPAEADEKGIDDAVVELSIEVAADGGVASVRIERDPGTGFGRVAASCARSKRFSPAEDKDGKRVHGCSRVDVRFQR